MTSCKIIKADTATLAVIGMFAKGAKITLEEYVARRLEEAANFLNDPTPASTPNQR